MNAQTHVLIAEGGTNGLGTVLGGAGVIPLVQPPNRVDWASNYDELTWNLSVLGITDGGTIGSPGNTLPTAFSIVAHFEYRQMHAGLTYRFQTGRWLNMHASEVATHIVEGVPWYGPGQTAPVPDSITGVGDGVICTQATAGYNGTTGLFANPIVLRRTLRHFPQGVRVNLSGSSFTGGTVPKVLLGLEVTGKRS